MTEARWSQAKDAFHRAYELPASQRPQFLATLDDELRSDVESLLRHDPKEFLEKSATQYAFEFLQHEPIPERLGAYRIVKELGRGGMATVYLAERADGQYEKLVAIKVLHGTVSGSDLRTRFLQERQLLANLDHPNIVRLMDGNVTPDGRPYLVEDYVEGTPITAYATQHNLAHRDRLRLFLQVVSAIVYSHALGVVHRDLKPDNILVSADGKVRLIDFGIAEIGAAQQNTSLRYWTPGYASPEQSRSEPAGPPSDVYSLAAVLFELITGKRYHPPLASEPALRGALRTLLTRCLAQYPAQRPSATELHSSVEAILSSRRRWIAMAASAALLIALAAFALPRSPSSLPSNLRSIPIAAEDSFEYEPVLSPNGKDVVFAWNEGDTSRGINLYRKPVAGGAPQRLTFAARRDAFPQYSPDGRQILFSRFSREGVQIIRLDLKSLHETAIHRIDSELEGRQRSIRWATWMPDGRHIALVQRLHAAGPYALFLARTDGAILRQLTFPPAHAAGDPQAAASPDGRYLAFVRYSTGTTSEIHILPLDGGEPRQLTHHATSHYGLSWSPDSRYLYFGARIRSARMSVYRMGIAPTSAVEQIPGIDGSASWPSVALADGRLRIVYVHDEETVNVRSSPSGKPIANLCPSTLFDGRGITISPDGKEAAFSSTRGGSTQIWSCQIATGRADLVSDPNHPQSESPRWSPDGTRIAYTVIEGDSTDIAIANRHTRTAELLRLPESMEGRPSWSHDGRHLYFRSDRDGSRRIWKMPVGGGIASAVAVTGPDAYEAIESPDGRWLYYAKDRAHPGLFRIPASGGAEQKAADGVREGWWDVAIPGLYWIRQQGGDFSVESLPFGANKVLRLATLPEGGGVWSGFSVSSDGSTFYWSQTTRHSVDVMLLEGL